ncbi:hypothetical protein F5Y08DRAFT_186479 [Xylaria arbuscula]|nr:hypothetical protein F5Y08DRAFT_186479 [Xylaria arbuscula]
MKLFLIASAAALVHAQADSTGYFPGEPSCALPCLSSAITAAGCALSDIGCQCGPTQTAIAEKVGACIFTACTNPTDLGAAVNAGQAVCSSFFASELPFTTPEGASDTGPSVTPAPTSTSSGSGDSSSSGSSDASSSTSGTTGPVTSPPTSTATSSSGSGSESGDTTHKDTLIGSSSLSLTGSLTSLPSSTPTTGAAVAPAGVGAGVLAGILGIIAFL